MKRTAQLVLIAWAVQTWSLLACHRRAYLPTYNLPVDCTQAIELHGCNPGTEPLSCKSVKIDYLKGCPVLVVN